ncbi:hypothetical protein QYE76_035903 [Lolium multiflorum]|uniref:Pectinesterase inhibitor domain-containing protein n=1 Tax=Lolium multiflorum TaxID=4521 RepID=A0AAD8VPG7_LOLMU|nr:hypothetical protein QYE76_035903 [Lolium multiflorum]
MKPSTTRPVALVAAVLASILSSACTVDATLALTCKAAAAIDVRVNLQMCESLMVPKDKDAWGMARNAADEGAINAAVAANAINKTLLAGSASVARESLLMNAALGMCLRRFEQATLSFSNASKEIGQRRNQLGGRNKLDGALAQVQECKDAFAMRGLPQPQPLAQNTTDAIQMAIIANAIICTVDAAVASNCKAALSATVDSTCKAAAASDPRVNLQLCVSQLGVSISGRTANAWSLAKAACDEGVYKVILAGSDATTLLEDKSTVPSNKPVLETCAAVYDKAGMAFTQAGEQIELRNLAAATSRMDEVLAKAQEKQCDGAALRALVPTPPQKLLQNAADSVQMAIIAKAIINLIK